MIKPRCSNCIHVNYANSGTTMHCIWEKNFLPPPVFRARLWGKEAPETKDYNAENCPQYVSEARAAQYEYKPCGPHCTPTFCPDCGIGF